MSIIICVDLITQTYFKELTDNDLRSRIFEEQQNLIEQDMDSPFVLSIMK